MEFKPFPKLSRWSRDVVMTEKLDGTNACVVIDLLSEYVGAQSRNKIVTPEPKDDPFGFARWVEKNKDFLAQTLGDGYHYGEWWGQGIQRNYGLNSKKFSLFNAERWKDLSNNEEASKIGLGVVPTLWKGSMNAAHIQLAIKMQELEEKGSVAAPGFMKPEGVVIYHTAGGYLFKKTFEKDDTGKEQ